MKQVKRIDEYTNENGELQEIEIRFEDNMKVIYKANNFIRKGNLQLQVTRIDEFKDSEGKIQELEIHFKDKSKIVYKGEITRKGNL